MHPAVTREPTRVKWKKMALPKPLTRGRLLWSVGMTMS